MKRKSRPALSRPARFAALCLQVGVLLTSLACGRIDLGSTAESEPEEEAQQHYPPPQITLGPPTTRVEFGPDRGRPNGNDPLGSGNVTAPLDGPDAGVADASSGTSDEPSDAGVDADAP